jgi:quinohemoprotein amine dehydrogenase
MRIVRSAVFAEISLLAIGLTAAGTLSAQQGGTGRGAGAPREAAAAEKPEEGIPVTDTLVQQKCGGCHVKDDKGNMARISWERSTPEGWEEAIKRMVRLNGLTLAPTEARSILKYLSTYHGLAPEEAKPVMYMPEHRIKDEAFPSETVRTVCMNCHPLGRAFSWRRSKEDWKLLTNMHIAFFPQADAAFRRRGARGGGGGEGGGGGGGGGGGAAAAAAGADGQQGPPPVDEVVDFLGKTYGLHSPEWSAWRARMRAPRLAGKWIVSAHIPGHGDYFGEMTITPGAAEDEFKTQVKLQSVIDGSKLERSGQGLVYAGYSWRGRSKGARPGAAPGDLSAEMREALWISADQSHAEGRWFCGEYQEFGMDVTLERASADPQLISLNRRALKSGSAAERVKLFGANFPTDITPQDLDFGSGVTVKSIASHTATEIVAEVAILADAVPGKRDVFVKRAVLPNALAVYDRIDYIKVLPDTSLAHLGSDVHPKGYQQFEAIAFQRGADGKINTADDVNLGPIDVTWSVEEFYAVYGDDDKEFVGTLNSSGFFTPALDGPNPQRKFQRNNYGDVWVVATSKNEKDKYGKPLVGKSYLVVTVPTYIRWDQPEVSQ